MDLAALVASPWSWIALGGLLLALEVVVPGASLLWLGIAAGLTGAASFAFALDWQLQVALFAVLSVISVIVGRRFTPARDKASDRPFLNRRADALVGHVLVLESAIEGGFGTVRVDDTVWRCEGPALPGGTRVRVTRAAGPVLIVEPA
ncbi:NfeD family protein [Aquabacter cavernae]|uniref:NfeD family protein n=1 Tax=Aquabacter cavernae TaxID=2496029 RepID=UPI000F8D04FA|nr:NfeD family protein [Aquabacter cavernae]